VDNATDVSIAIFNSPRYEFEIKDMINVSANMTPSIPNSTFLNYIFDYPHGLHFAA